jgi:hypothetical protein
MPQAVRLARFFHLQRAIFGSVANEAVDAGADIEPRIDANNRRLWEHRYAVK